MVSYYDKYKYNLINEWIRTIGPYLSAAYDCLSQQYIPKRINYNANKETYTKMHRFIIKKHKDICISINAFITLMLNIHKLLRMQTQTKLLA